jgi:hypothetical protein
MPCRAQPAPTLRHREPGDEAIVARTGHVVGERRAVGLWWLRSARCSMTVWMLGATGPPDRSGARARYAWDHGVSSDL